MLIDVIASAIMLIDMSLLILIMLFDVSVLPHIMLVDISVLPLMLVDMSEFPYHVG
jgi:hypothetical protein